MGFFDDIGSLISGATGGSLGDALFGGTVDTGGALADLAAQASPSGLAAQFDPSVAMTGWEGAMSAGTSFAPGDVLAMGGSGAPGAPVAGAAAPGGFMSDLQGMAKAAVPWMQLGTGAAGIGAAGLGAYNAAQQRALLAQAQKAQLQAAKPASQFAATALQRAEQGQLSPQQQAAIEQWKANAKARIRQYLAKAGLSSSTAAADWDRYIDQQAMAMAASWIQQEAQLGIGATQAATGAAGGLARTAQMEGTGLSQSIADANRAISSLAALG